MTTPPFDPKYTVYKTVGGSSRIGQNNQTRRYLVLYMRFWSTCLFFMKPSLPASPITRCVRYPDRLVPGMYVLPTPPVNPERPVSGTPHLLNVLAPEPTCSETF